MKIIGFPRSRAIRALWAAEEAGVPYEVEWIDPRKLASPEFRTLNPAGKVPVLVDGDLVLSESAAICTWLGQKAPDKALVPREGTPEWGRYLQFCFFVLSELEQPLWLWAKHKFALPRAVRVEGLGPAVEHEWTRYTQVVESALNGRPYLVGDHFTIADLLTAQTLDWGHGLGHALSEPLEAWTRTQCARPALARARAVDKSGG